ncbi:MAG TPA: hypothetical protein VMQ73_23390 [Methylomirabilota bacterium]|nr:hypothetical protein [Methylomirabilota bacterium]HTY66876.1 hypothetical protein [Alphaproteobacteria bacterium]
MGLIEPRMSWKDLQKGARDTAKGKKRHPLPGVKTAKATPKTAGMHRKDRLANGELAEKISAAVREVKKSDRHGPLWVVGWRMYPNRDHPHWKAHTHACACGCGCFTHHKPGHRKRKR